MFGPGSTTRGGRRALAAPAPAGVDVALSTSTSLTAIVSTVTNAPRTPAESFVDRL